MNNTAIGLTVGLGVVLLTIFALKGSASARGQQANTEEYSAASSSGSFSDDGVGGTRRRRNKKNKSKRK